MEFNRIRILSWVAVLVTTLGPAQAADDEQVRAVAIATEVERIARTRTLWPEFDPMVIPLAIYTGNRTWLFRHPSPPEGFFEVADTVPGTYALEGRHPAMVANTSAEIGDVASATLLADGARADFGASRLATTALHEAFHVYQRAEHPGWVANEGDLFVYPTDDAELLALRRRETAGLRRALGASDHGTAACWSRHALALRSERFRLMDPSFSAYERLTELNEGLAHYIELFADGQTTVDIPDAGFPIADIRPRAYTAGAVLALLLDRLRPGWQTELASDDAQYLDDMLETAAAKETTESEQTCALPDGEVAEIERTAKNDTATLIARRGERREAFDSHPGWRVVVEAAGDQPLLPRGFDPLNVERVEGGILHTRLLRLGNESGQLEMIRASGDNEALTEAAGEHPLFNGVRRVIIAGLPEPEIEKNDREVSVRGEGLELHFEAAAAKVRGTEIHIVIDPR